MITPEKAQKAAESIASAQDALVNLILGPIKREPVDCEECDGTGEVAICNSDVFGSCVGMSNDEAMRRAGDVHHMEECSECNGSGKQDISNCCGVFLPNWPDSDICPKCGEHCERDEE